MDSTLKRTWAEIDLDALAHNYTVLRNRIGADVKFLGVVKADAYGHGSVQVSRLLQEMHADYLAVSSIDEAVELRLNDITMPILILGHTPKEQVGRLIKYNITQAVTCKAKALEYSEEAVRLGGTLKIHIKVDTGMSRLGYLCDGDYFDTGVEGICEGCSLPGLDAEGIFTHFAVSDEPGEQCEAYTRHQFQLFTEVNSPLRQHRRRCPLSRNLAGHGPSGTAFVRLRRICRRIGTPARHEFKSHRQHHQDLSRRYGCQLRRHLRHRQKDPHGRYSLRLCRRLFPLPVQPLQPDDIRRACSPARQNLHGHVHD